MDTITQEATDLNAKNLHDWKVREVARVLQEKEQANKCWDDRLKVIDETTVLRDDANCYITNPISVASGNYLRSNF